MLTYVALVLGILAVFLAWRMGRKNSELQERIAQVNSRVYHLRREMQESQEKFEHDLVAFKFQVLKAQGNLKVTPEMKMSEIVLERNPPKQIEHLLGINDIRIAAELSLEDHLPSTVSREWLERCNIRVDAELQAAATAAMRELLLAQATDEQSGAD